MTTRTSRKAAALPFAALASLGLAACSPPNEQPSDQKVDTATSQNPNSLTGEGQVASTESADSMNVTDAGASAAATSTTAREAAEAGADGTPFYLDCDGAAVQQPGEIVLNCKDQNEFATDIEWDSWTDDIAEGTAKYEDRENNRSADKAKVILSSPEVVDGKLVFTQISVDGATKMPQTDY